MVSPKGDGRNSKVAVVTGGNRGIGKEVCRQLAQDGMLVILTARQIENAELAASDINEQVVPYQLDVTNEESVERLSAFIKDSYGRVDVLINNAGVFLDNIMDDAFPSFLDLPVSTLQENDECQCVWRSQSDQGGFPLHERGWIWDESSMYLAAWEGSPPSPLQTMLGVTEKAVLTTGCQKRLCTF